MFRDNIGRIQNLGLSTMEHVKPKHDQNRISKDELLFFNAKGDKLSVYKLYLDDASEPKLIKTVKMESKDSISMVHYH